MELEAKWVKIKAQQVEEPPFALSMNAMAKALKVLHDLKWKGNQHATFSGIKKWSLGKGDEAKQGGHKGHEELDARSFHGKGYQSKKG